jgi:hypothetical protein
MAWIQPQNSCFTKKNIIRLVTNLREIVLTSGTSSSSSPWEFCVMLIPWLHRHNLMPCGRYYHFTITIDASSVGGTVTTTLWQLLCTQMGEADLIKNWVPNQSGFLSTKLHDDSASSSIRNQHDELQNIYQQQHVLLHNQESAWWFANINQQQQLLVHNQEWTWLFAKHYSTTTTTTSFQSAMRLIEQW